MFCNLGDIIFLQEFIYFSKFTFVVKTISTNTLTKLHNIELIFNSLLVTVDHNYSSSSFRPLTKLYSILEKV